jgi:hypothetical protein
MRIIRILLLPFFASLFIHSACNKEDGIAANYKFEFVDSLDVGFVRLVHCFAGNTPQLPTVTNTGPQVFFYANGNKMNGNVLSYAGNWPSPSVYANMKTGNNIRFDVVMGRLNLNVVPNVPAPAAGDTLLTFNQTIQKGKFYTFYIGDTTGAPLRVIVREDQLPEPEEGRFKIRLANFTMNATDTLVLYSRVFRANMSFLAAHKEVTDWVEFPMPPVLNDTIEIRRKNTVTPLYYAGGAAPTAFTPIGKRMYTVVCRGKTGVTAKGPSASVVTNR